MRYWLHLFQLLPDFQRRGLLAERDHGSGHSGHGVLLELIIHIMKNSRLFILYGASKGLYFEWKKRNDKGNERIGENILYMDFKFLDGKIWI